MSWLNEFATAQQKRTDNNSADVTATATEEQQPQITTGKAALVREIVLTYKERNEDDAASSKNTNKLFNIFSNSNNNKTNTLDNDEDDVELEDEELRQMLDQPALRRRKELQLRGGKSVDHPSMTNTSDNNNTSGLKKSKTEGDDNEGFDEEEEAKLRHMENLRMKMMAARNNRDG